MISLLGERASQKVKSGPHRVLMIYKLVIDFLKFFASGRPSDTNRPLRYYYFGRFI